MYKIKPLEWHVHKSLIGYKICAYDVFGHEFARYDSPDPAASIRSNAFEAFKHNKEREYKLKISSAFEPKGLFTEGDKVEKISGSWWAGNVVGFYSTQQTPIGYAVQLNKPNGPVQIYPANALQAFKEKLI